MSSIIIISDLHLASDVCRSEKIYSFLDSLETEHLILNGDVMDNLNFHRLTKSHWKILKKLRSMSKSMKITWIKGNHDTDKAEVIANLIGIDFIDEYFMNIKGKRTLIIHGDKFDVFMKKRPVTSKIADYIYKLIQWYDKWVNNDFYYSGLVKSKSKVLIRCGRVIENAITYALHMGYDIIICGHTHFPDALTNSSGSVQYYNSGSWTDKKCTFISIREDLIEVKEYHEEKNSKRS